MLISLHHCCLLQIKVMTEHDLLAVACEQFLGKSVNEIKGVVLQTLEGHLRSILGTDIHFHCVFVQIRTCNLFSGMPV